MRKIVIDADEWIKEMENSKYKVVFGAYSHGCNDVLDYYIEKFKRIAAESANDTKE